MLHYTTRDVTTYPISIPSKTPELLLEPKMRQASGHCNGLRMRAQWVQGYLGFRVWMRAHLGLGVVP